MTRYCGFGADRNMKQVLSTLSVEPPGHQQSVLGPLSAQGLCFCLLTWWPRPTPRCLSSQMIIPSAGRPLCLTAPAIRLMFERQWGAA
jgi:hypothetical protein